MMQLYWVALKSIWAKEIHRFMRIWVQTLVPPVITMTLYFIIFGNLIGSRIGEMHGFSYMQFIVPGLIMMAVITNSYANVASSFFSAKFQRNIEELLVAPVPTHVIIAGFVGGGVARGLCVGILVTAISLFFVPFQVYSWIFVALTLILTAILFSLAGLLNAVFAKTFDDISLIPTFCADAVDLPRRGILLANAAAAVLAEAVAPEPDCLHDKWFPLWFPRYP
ncbi:ABC transporter [Salmonella enterica subsp. arizonae]|uniref:ABC transporter n=1 Tax=Salmonella enterica subsp. arizonae TaxID=59203 RepID=A0A379SBG7_SALER|nr:ABC transporter [Salmonella enterica subsp. arizonae]